MRFFLLLLILSAATANAQETMSIPVKATYHCVKGNYYFDGNPSISRIVVPFKYLDEYFSYDSLSESVKFKMETEISSAASRDFFKKLIRAKIYVFDTTEKIKPIYNKPAYDKSTQKIDFLYIVFYYVELSDDATLMFTAYFKKNGELVNKKEIQHINKTQHILTCDDADNIALTDKVLPLKYVEDARLYYDPKYQKIVWYTWGRIDADGMFHRDKIIDAGTGQVIARDIVQEEVVIYGKLR